MVRHYYDQISTNKVCGEQYESEMEITYVVYLIDGNGEEFLITQEDEVIRVNAFGAHKPLVIKSLFQVSAQLIRLRKKYSSTYRLFGLEYGEFLERKDKLIK